MRIHKESNSTFTLPRVSRWNTLQAFSGGAGFRTSIPHCSRKDAKHAVKRMATFIEDLATLRHNLKTIFDSWDEMPIEVIESVASSDLGNMHTQLMISYHTEESARAETEALLATGMALEEVALLARILSGLPFSPTEAYGLRQTFVNSGDTDGGRCPPISVLSLSPFLSLSLSHSLSVCLSLSPHSTAEFMLTCTITMTHNLTKAHVGGRLV